MWLINSVALLNFISNHLDLLIILKELLSLPIFQSAWCLVSRGKVLYILRAIGTSSEPGYWVFGPHIHLNPAQ